MPINVRLFAAARQLAGTSAVPLAIDEPVTVAQLRQALGTHLPALAPLLPMARFARNGDYVNDQSTVSPQDEIALIPPVSGG